MFDIPIDPIAGDSRYLTRLSRMKTDLMFGVREGVRPLLTARGALPIFADDLDIVGAVNPKSIQGSLSIVSESFESRTALLRKGKISIEEWNDGVYSDLAFGHTKSWQFGRKLIQPDVDFDVADWDIGFAAADEESFYLAGFKQNLLDGDPRYFDDDGNLREDAVNRRLDSYLKSMRGTANESSVAALPATAQIYWIFGAVEHCQDCIDAEELGPYDPDEMFIFPSDGSTDCKFNCKCHLVYEFDGKSVSGFDPF